MHGRVLRRSLPVIGLRPALVAAVLICSSVYGCGEGNGDADSTFTLEFAVTSASGRVGALQLEVTYLGDSGGFIASGDSVDCEALVDGLVAANYLGERTAKMGIVNIQGFSTPAPVLRCGFHTEDALDASSFNVDVVDASSPGGNPIDPTPTVDVTVTER